MQQQIIGPFDLDGDIARRFQRVRRADAAEDGQMRGGQRGSRAQQQRAKHAGFRRRDPARAVTPAPGGLKLSADHRPAGAPVTRQLQRHIIGRGGFRKIMDLTGPAQPAGERIHV